MVSSREGRANRPNVADAAAKVVPVGFRGRVLACGSGLYEHKWPVMPSVSWTSPAIKLLKFTPLVD
ncbi:MAG: hypothetical protein M3Y54_01695, partial [Bacteroidota bacterium]|nr:hypothetical protein [Bacteroidota bacterium]